MATGSKSVLEPGRPDRQDYRPMTHKRRTMNATACLLAAGLLSVCLVSCSQPPGEEAIIGKWREVVTGTNFAPLVASLGTNPAPAIFEFRPNGLLVTKGPFSPDLTFPGLGDRPLTNPYSFMDERTMRIIFGRGRPQERTVTMQFALSGNRLVLTEVSRDLAKTDTSALARTNGHFFTKTNFILARSNLPPANWGGARGVLTLERIK
jgi:hypothetical protein